MSEQPKDDVKEVPEQKEPQEEPNKKENEEPHEKEHEEPHNEEHEETDEKTNAEPQQGVSVDDGGTEPHERRESFGGEEPSKFIMIDLPGVDQNGNQVVSRVTVPVIREVKERKFKLVKRKRIVPVTVRKGDTIVEEEEEQEYDACMLVETVTQTVRIREVKENGEVNIREEDLTQELYIGKERKYKILTVEKSKKDGSVEEIEEIEVESEEESIGRKRKRVKKKVKKKKYDSEHEYIGEGLEWEWEWTDEEEGGAKEEFSHIEEEEFKWTAGEEEYQEEEIELEDEEWKAVYEILEEEGEEEEVEVEEEEEIIELIPKETSWEREQKRQKSSFYNLMKLFLKEIRRRKILMKDIKLLCRIIGVKPHSPGKEFEKNPQKYIDEETADVDALIKHVFKVHSEYTQEEETYKKEMKELNIDVTKLQQEFKNRLLDAIKECDPKILDHLLKGMDTRKCIDEVFKYEELLSKEYVKKAIHTLSIEQIKYLLFTEVDQSSVPDEDKDVDVFELDKMFKALKNFENEGLEVRGKLERQKKKFTEVMEDVICKMREAEYLADLEEEFFKRKPLIEKELAERKETYWKLRKYVDDWRKLDEAKRMANTKERFPAIYHKEKMANIDSLRFNEVARRWKHVCPHLNEDFLKGLAEEIKLDSEESVGSSVIGNKT